MKNIIEKIRVNKIGVALAVIIGLISFVLSKYLPSGLADPLLLALLFGMLINALRIYRVKSQEFNVVPFLFIPMGVIFYAFNNLNFVKISEIKPGILLLLIFIILTYYSATLLLGKLFGQKKEITYLTATGGAICGASAITIISPSVNAEPDDVSVSLISVAIAAVFGLFILLPFLAIYFGLTNELYGLMSGSVLQFTGFVKASVATMPPLTAVMSDSQVMNFALSVKAARYLGLLVALPLFASLVKGRVTLPWYLWAFLFSGIFGSIVYRYYPLFYSGTLSPVVSPVYNILWATSMAAIGMSTNFNKFFSNVGLKTLAMAFLGFFAAISVFLIGISIMY